MVWHVCLLTTNDEHLFTGEAWGLCEGKEARGLCGGFSFIQFIQSKESSPPTREVDMMKKMNSLTVMKKQTHQAKQTSS